MFNTNHYKALANSLKASKPTGIMDRLAWMRVVHTLAHDLHQDNPYFKKNKFYAQCDCEGREEGE